MKRIAIFILIAVVLSCFCGCQSNVGDRFVYTGIDDDLYTETLHSILGVTGKDRNPEHGWIEPLIQVVDQDSYGRKMFLYYEGYTSNHFFLLVEQNKDADFVYYYSDYNFAIGECDNTLPQDLTTEQTGFMYFYLDYMWRARFTEEQISALKSNNDWNQEINKEKCIKQKKVRKTEDPLSNKEKVTLYNELFAESRNDGDIYVDYVTIDDEGKLLYFASNIDSSLMDYRMVIIDGDSHYNKKITDVMAYQEQLAAFKREHNWKKS